MDQNSTVTPAEMWDLPLEDPLAGWYTTRDIAFHVELLLSEIGLQCNPETGEYEWVEPSRATARALCEDLGHDWPSVAGEMRSIQFARSASTSEEDAVTPEGIPVRTSVLRSLTFGLAPLCPFIRRGISRAAYQYWRREKDCGSWACEKCGPGRADRLLRRVEWTLRAAKAEQLYVAKAIHRPGLFNMLAHRAPGVSREYLWIRDVAGVVTYVSTQPLPGRKEASVWSALSVDEVIDEVRQALWVPGHMDHGSSTGWSGINETTDSAEGAPSFKIEGLTDHQVTRVLALFKEEAKKSHDVDINSGHIPQEHRSALDELMEDIIEQVREGSDGS